MPECQALMPAFGEERGESSIRQFIVTYAHVHSGNLSG